MSQQDNADLLKKVLEQIEATAHIQNMFMCYDCEKVLADLPFSDEEKKRMRRSSHGYYLIVCKDCFHNDEEI